MRFNSIKAGLLGSTFVGTAMLAAPALAQDGDAEAEATSQESTIVVTARKREEDLVDVPLPVSVATQEQLDRDQIYNLNDLQRVTPALEISQTFGGETNGGGRLRGIGTGVFNPSVASSVALVVDQVPIGNLSFPQLYDLAQVEVLRGPQGTLFGQGASAGVINVSTRTPDFGDISVNGSVDFADKGTAGSEVGEVVLNAGFNLPLGDSVALRVAGQYKEESGLQRSVTTGRDNSIEDFGIRGRLRIEPSAALSVQLGAEYGRETSDGQTFFAIAIAPNSLAGFDPDGPGPSPVIGPIGPISTGAYLDPNTCALPEISERAELYCEFKPSYLETEVLGFSSVIDLELTDDLSVTSVTSYRERSFEQAHRDYSRIFPAPAAQQTRTLEESHGFSQELRLSYISDVVDVVGGGFYQDFAFDRSPTGGVFGSNLAGERVGFSVCNPDGTFCPVGAQFTDEDTQNRTLAGFVDATVRLGDQFSVFGGLRFDDYHNTTTVQLFPAIPGNVGGPNSPANTFDTDDSNLSGRIGVSFQPNPDSNIFASYSRGYKPPAVGTDTSGALFQLDPEAADAFELGARFDLGNIQLSGNVFYNRVSNFQAQTSVFVGTALISTPINIDEIEARGFELAAFGEVVPGLNLNVGYQFNNIEFPDGFIGDDGVDIGGRQYLYAPKHKFTLSADYGVEVTPGIEAFLNANLIYKSKTLFAARSDPRYVYPGHELINGGLGLRDPDGGWNVSLFVRNLTKEREPMAYLANTFANQTDGGIRSWPIAGLTARVVGIRAGFEY